MSNAGFDVTARKTIEMNKSKTIIDEDEYLVQGYYSHGKARKSMGGNLVMEKSGKMGGKK